MFFWDHPVGRKVFAMTAEQSKFSAALAANQGLYNGFLAAGLFWSLWSGSLELKTFFLGCVVIAGAYGGATAKAFHLDYAGASRDRRPGIGVRRSHLDREPVVGALGVDVGGPRQHVGAQVSEDEPFAAECAPVGHHRPVVEVILDGLVEGVGLADEEIGRAGDV